MNFEHTKKTKELINLVSNFIKQKISPREKEYDSAMAGFRDSGNPGQVPEVLTELKQEAREQGPHCFARGTLLYKVSKQQAKEKNLDFNEEI